MRLPILKNNPACDDCALHEAATSVCIPTVPWRGGKRRAQALLVLGEAPGFHEDAEGTPFVGDSGALLRNVYLGGIQADTLADVYIGNVVRCRPPQNRTPKPAEFKACSKYWLADFEELSRCYERVTILCCGASAAAMVSGYKSLTEAIRHQGARVLNGRARAFFVSHPAHCLRDESKIIGVVEQLSMLVEYLTTGDLTMTVEMPPPKIGAALKADRVVFDIETYGLFRGRPAQTAFHPMYAKYIDKVPIAGQIESLAIATSPRQVGYYHWAKPGHQARAVSALSAANRIDGMNLNFDLLHVRAASPAFRHRMDRKRPLLVDLSTVSFVECDARDEKSLKSLSPLFRVSEYHDGDSPVKSKKNVQVYAGPADREAMEYNCQDAVSTLCCIDEVFGRLRAAGRRVNVQWWSDVQYVCLHMAENGVRFNRAFFEKEHQRELWTQGRMAAKAKRMFGRALEGKGSVKDAREMAAEAHELLPDECLTDIQLTEAKQEISVNDANREIFLKHLPAGGVRRFWEIYDKFKRSQKITSSVTGPMLDRHITPHGIVYPNWRCVPTHAKDGQGGTGGQRQGRLAPKPGIVTFPRKFLGCPEAVITRFPRGNLLHIDLSQIELRVAAFLSGDPVMCNEYEQGIDLHWLCALELYGDDPVAMAMADPAYRRQGEARRVDMDDPKAVRNWLRQGGKHPNFGMLYLVGADTLHETILKKVGIFLSHDVCQGIIDSRVAKYRRIAAWRQEQIAFVAEHGYLDVPPEAGAPGFEPIGLRRTWAMGACDPDDLRIAPEIVNFKVQAVAALMMLAAQIEIDKLIGRQGLRSCLTLNHYDACEIDTPPDETAIIVAALGDAFLRNPYIRALETAYGRKFPLKIGHPESLYELSINGVKQE